MKALVTGATGFVGQRLCRELVEHGYQVRAMRRASSSLKGLEGLSLEFVEGDFADHPSLARAVQGVDLVFHIGAVYREAKFDDSVYWAVNCEGTRMLLEASRAAGVTRFVHCSTTGVMGHIAHPPAREDHPYHPGDVYQQSKTEAERIALEFFRSGELDGCVIRPAMIWGPRDTRLFKLFKGIATRRMPMIGSGETLNHWILVDDLVRAFRLAAENPRTRGELYIIAGERIVTLRHTMETIASIYDVKLWPFSIPALPIQLLGSAVEAVCRPLGVEPPIHRRRADFFIKSRAFDTSKAREHLGFKPTYTFEEEAAYVARWYVDNGWLTLPDSAVPLWVRQAS